MNRRNEIYICDSYNDRVQIFGLDLNYKHVLGSAVLSANVFPSDVDFDTSGNIYIVCNGINVHKCSHQLNNCCIQSEASRSFVQLVWSSTEN